MILTNSDTYSGALTASCPLNPVGLWQRPLLENDMSKTNRPAVTRFYVNNLGMTIKEILVSVSISMAVTVLPCIFV